MVYDVAIIGSGMAGASLAAALAPQMRVLIIEMEERPGYHATGRSAAFWNETYGGPLVQPLTTASGPFLENPPAAFADNGFLLRRGALMIGRTGDGALETQFHKDFEGSGVRLSTLGRSEMEERIPGLRPSWDRAVWEANTADVDVGALHQAYVRAAQRAGVEIALRQPVSELQRDAKGVWTITSPNGTWRAARIINAAGAWASDVAQMAGALPIQIQPLRRTMVQLRLGCDIPMDLPLTIDLAGRFYFKPEGPRRLWLSPHDETPSIACDAAPEEVDVARAIDELQHVVDWPIEAVERRWAGLRSFAPDRAPVFGEDPSCAGFYWCAGQGGFGIQTAPAIAALLAAEILGVSPDAPYDGIDPAPYRPARFS